MMLTFLRKIRKSLIHSGSAQKYIIYALGEILLVVVGILIALQINNWNEWKKERNVEHIVLEDIRESIVRNNQLIASALQIFDQIDHSTQIVKAAIDRKSQYSDSLDIHFSHFIKHGGFLLRLNTDGYESLKNIGFGILQNENLKDQILSLFEVTYSNYEIELQWGNSAYSGGYGWWKEYLHVVQHDKFVPIDYDNILNNKRFLSEINEMEIIRETIRVKINECLSHNESVLQLIHDELSEAE